ncbi:cysteine proteinase [Plenodomus tracheiphilus IPT5]|uniref:ubiquitinyl hydrolase 1 n=1 Tax=Plenodomus tracheiphilus IPT5 TaxID=1408161 RepID=A0A6A7AWC1_9PLEO|nr:cysteine proteinase [Plenodomus tracheiphilus IPT5]
MDPESLAFQPREDFWQFQNDMLRVQQTQAELTDRVSRLERKQEDDSRLKNVWGTSSPFPSVLGGTPQQVLIITVPLHQPTVEHFSSFDDQSNNLIGNLQLDADEEPRRVGATSRANSVRFDETANHGHWAHASRSSLDLIPRTGSSLGGHALSERSYSHKSDGRQSSAGQSVHSAASGRANSLTSFGTAPPVDAPGLAPGLFILGSVPAIIRCWLNTDFKHDTLLYAAVCSGSYASYLDLHLIERLGFQDHVVDDDGVRKIKLSVYLPEAVPVSQTSRSMSPAPQLPSVGVEFTVIEQHSPELNPKAIQIYLGSDTLRAHNADILFSSNQLTLYDDDGSKLRIPLIRPEDDRAFKSLSTTSMASVATGAQQSGSSAVRQASREETTAGSATVLQAPSIAASRRNNNNNNNNDNSTAMSSEDGGSSGRASLEQRPRLGLTTNRTGSKDGQDQTSVSGASRSAAPPAIWSNWRREQQEKSTAGSVDWANVGKTSASDPAYQRRDTGIKVLKPSKPIRTLSTSTSSPVTGQSRFFDDGKRRGEGETNASQVAASARRAVSGEMGQENVPGLGKGRPANPVGGASAFAWLNSGGTKGPTSLLLATRCPAFAFSSAGLVCPEAPRASRRAPSFTTSSNNSKKRRIVTPARNPSRDGRHSPNVGTGVGSPRSSPHPSASPPRYLPPHLHDEVLPLDTAQDPGSLPARDNSTGASSPSEAYANLTLDSREGSTPTSEQARTTAPPDQRPPPRSSSPAKRLHSDMDNDNDNTDAPASSVHKEQVAGIPTPQRSARATSVEMVDAPNNSEGSETEATSVDQANLPSVDEQVARVMAIMGIGPEDGHEGYVVPEKWLARVWSRTSEHTHNPEGFEKDAMIGPIGPVDTSALVDTSAMQAGLVDLDGNDFVPLSTDATMGQDFEVLPAKAWELVIGWHGLKQGSPVIRRHARNSVPHGETEHILWELYPPILTIRKIRKTPPTTTETAKPAEQLVASKYGSFANFIEAAKKAAGIDLNNKVRIWRILQTAPTDESQPSQPSGILTPDASPRGGSPVTSTSRPPLIMDVASFNGLKFGSDRELVTGKDEEANEKYNKSLTLEDAGVTQNQTIVLEEHDEKGEYISDTTALANNSIASGQLTKGLQSNPNSGRNTPTSGALTRGRTRSGKVRGHVGLTNLGNTCYMNSALQCLRSVEELSMYFLNNKWKEEINVDNPIGHKGAIAKVYANLLSQIYDIGNTSSFAPKNFKQTLGRANGLFSGYGQQDSQEFVSWLVDALHEDLNRVHVKPYRENPDSDDNTFKDPNAVRQLGETYRDNHRARNDSVATDLFSGFYKNTMVCPECDKVSITFDPYSQLTLQLPIEQTWTHTITYVPLLGRPYQLEIDIDKNATIKSLKEFVGKRGGGVPANRIMASEVYSHKFYRHLDDASTIAETNIGARDDLFFYELDNAPSNWPAPKKKGSKYKVLLHGSSDEDIPDSASPLHDRVVIPVFHRGPSASSYRSQTFAMALWPFHIVLTREEAKDYDTILRKVLAKVAQATTRPILSELNTEFSQTQSRSGSDVVLTTEEDASPNDPQVKDGSIEGEDMVEVTMAESAEAPVQQSSGHNATQDAVPEVLRPGSFIPPQFRQLFDLKHTKKSGEFVTTGWSTVDHSRTLDSITKRIRLPPSREESTQSSTAGESTSSDEDEDTLTVDPAAAIEAANVSSDEDMVSVEQETPAARSGRGKKNKKARKQQRKQERKHKNNKNFKSKKGRVPDQPDYPDDPDDESDNSLIRMGEAIVIEWNPEAYEALFGGSSDDDPRGQDVMKFTETLNDPEIQEKKAKRVARRKHGITLEECFTETSKSEVLSEDNAWYCSRCKELRRATKTLEIWTVPDILIIHLKRFSGHRSFRDKIEELIDFPVEGLDLSGKVGFPESKDLTYDLFAVDNHYGGLGGGHYTATAQNFFDKQWYDYNDSIVSKCESGQKAVSRAAYLLFYRRRSPAPLGPPSLQQIVTAANSQNSEDDADDADTDALRSRSPAGNGSRLGDSSRNGSSSAGAIAAGVGALRGAGSALSVVGSRLKNGVAAAGTSLSDDETDADADMDTLPPYNHDEGYDDNEDAQGEYTTGYTHANSYDQPMWSFNSLRNRDDGSDVASDMPALLGSSGGEELESRLMEDFGDEMGVRAGVGTPIEALNAPLGGGSDDEEEVAEIRLRDD